LGLHHSGHCQHQQHEQQIFVIIYMIVQGRFARKNIALFVGLPVPMKRNELVNETFVAENQPLVRLKFVVAWMM